MTRKIAVIDGHPDPHSERYCHALADAYAEGAASSGHSVRRLTLAELDIPLLRSRQDWQSGDAPASIKHAQDAIAWADHLVIIYPLWLGTMPALLKAFFEQTFRPGFAIRPEAMSLRPGLLNGKSARIVITMGMPAWLYRWFFGAHSIKALKRNILKFAGIGPVRETLIGGIESIEESKRKAWLGEFRKLGRDAR